MADSILDGLAAGQSASGIDLGAAEAPMEPALARQLTPEAAPEPKAKKAKAAPDPVAEAAPAPEAAAEPVAEAAAEPVAEADTPAAETPAAEPEAVAEQPSEEKAS